MLGWHNDLRSEPQHIGNFLLLQDWLCGCCLVGWWSSGLSSANAFIAAVKLNCNKAEPGTKSHISWAKLPTCKNWSHLQRSGPQCNIVCSMKSQGKSMQLSSTWMQGKAETYLPSPPPPLPAGTNIAPRLAALGPL